MNEESLFIHALQIKNQSEREAYLLKACADDDQLRLRVEGLLQANWAEA